MIYFRSSVTTGRNWCLWKNAYRVWRVKLDEVFSHATETAYCKNRALVAEAKLHKIGDELSICANMTAIHCNLVGLKLLI